MIKVHIRRCWNRYGIEILFVEERDGHIYVAKPMKFEFQKTEEGRYDEPTLYIDYPIANQVLTAFAEALDEQEIKTDKDAKIQGTLEATRYHLEDLRKLLKLIK